MADIVAHILKDKGPCLSSTVLRVLIDEYMMSPTVARQRVSRRPENIRSLKKLPFPRNAKFLYFQSDYGSPVFWQGLTKALEESSPGDLVPEFRTVWNWTKLPLKSSTTGDEDDERQAVY